MASVKPVRHGLLLLMVSCVACAEEDGNGLTAVPVTSAASPQRINTFVGPISMETEDGDTLCDGQLSVTLRAGRLAGTGTCGDMDLVASGWLDDDGVISSGAVQIVSGDSPAPPDGGTLSGVRTGSTLELVWSLEIPLPDDPPIDDDYLAYTETVYGQGLLLRQQN